MGKKLVLLIIIFAAILIMINSNVRKSYQKLPELTNQQRLSDFDYLCNTLEMNFPYTQDYKSYFNIDFPSIKEEYKKTIAEAENDFEYFCFVYAFLSQFPSSHTDFVFPNYSSYNELRGYNKEAIKT